MKRLAFVLACILLGCSDPVIGHWESTDDKVELDFVESTDAAYEGEGNIYIRQVGDEDLKAYCEFEFKAYIEEGDVIELEGKFVGKCEEFGKFDDFDCRLLDGPLLECSTPDGNDVTYVREGAPAI